MFCKSLVLNSIRGSKDIFFSKPPTSLYQRWPFIFFGSHKFSGGLRSRKIKLLGLRIKGRSFYRKPTYFVRFSNRIRKRATVVSVYEYFWKKNKRFQKALSLTCSFNKNFYKRYCLFINRFNFLFTNNKKFRISCSDDSQKFYRGFAHYYVRRLFRLNLNKRARWFVLRPTLHSTSSQRDFTICKQKQNLKLKRRILLRKFGAARRFRINLLQDKKYKRYFYFFYKKNKIFKKRHKRILRLLRCRFSVKYIYMVQKLRRIKFFCFLGLFTIVSKKFTKSQFAHSNFVKGFFQNFQSYLVRSLRWAVRGLGFYFSNEFRNRLRCFLSKKSSKFLISLNCHTTSVTVKKRIVGFLNRFCSGRSFTKILGSVGQTRRIFFTYSSFSLTSSLKGNCSNGLEPVGVQKQLFEPIAIDLVEGISEVTRKTFRMFNSRSETGYFFLFISRILAKRGLVQRSYNFFFNYSFINKIFFLQKAFRFVNDNCMSIELNKVLFFKQQSLVLLQNTIFFKTTKLFLLQKLILAMIAAFCGPVLNFNLLTSNKVNLPLLSVVAPLFTENDLDFVFENSEIIKKPTWAFTSPNFISKYFSKFECFVEFKPWQKSGKLHYVPVFIQNQQRRKFCFLKMFRQAFIVRPERSLIERALLELSDFVVGGGLTIVRFTQFRESLKNSRPFIKYFKFLL